MRSLAISFGQPSWCKARAVTGGSYLVASQSLAVVRINLVAEEPCYG
ncbi:hypothetical protein TIFTF001_033125 [Ficus carica]|uniref:Uncharacterized protein n=1 Tax=Ficus carica TaxID=3494 RepID=A0AA88DXW4_FICCA|nr:hypothetical protein TIFTF001_033125 [Ficus carica]